MSDLIDRAAAIHALESEKTYSTVYKDGYSWTDYFKQYNAGLTDGIKALNNLPSAKPESKWIPVTERLPKPNEKEGGVQRYYLIQNEFDDMMVAAYRGNSSGNTWWEQMYTYKPIEDKVIAWRSLPELYREETEDGVH